MTGTVMGPLNSVTREKSEANVILWKVLRDAVEYPLLHSTTASSRCQMVYR